MTHTLKLSTDQIDNLRYALLCAADEERKVAHAGGLTASGAGSVCNNLERLYDAVVEQTGYPIA